MQHDNRRAEWTFEGIARTMPEPRDRDLGYDATLLNVQINYEGQNIDTVVVSDPENPDAWIVADPYTAVDVEWFASHEATHVRREYE